MKLRFLLLISLMFLKLSYGQESDKCNMLMLIFKNPQLIEKFGIDYYKTKPIIIVDVKHFFDNCKFHSIKNREISVVNDSAYLKEKSPEYIIIHNFLKKVNKYYIVIEYKNNGSYGTIEFINTKKGQAISKINMGYF